MLRCGGWRVEPRGDDACNVTFTLLIEPTASVSEAEGLQSALLSAMEEAMHTLESEVLRQVC